MDAPHCDTFQSLSAEIIDLCGRIHDAEYRLLELIRRLDALKPWKGAMPSCAHWLNWRCGLDLVTAREKVRVAHALAELPRIREHFRRGELSYSKVRALTRIAEPGTEEALVEMALDTTAAHVEALVRARRQAARLDTPGAALNAWRPRYLECHPREDGSLVFEGRLPAEVGALLLKALDRAMEWMQEAPPAPGGDEAPGMECCRRGDSAESSGAAPPATGGDEASGMERCRGDNSAESSGAGQAAVHSRQALRSLSARRADALGVLAERFLAQPPAAEETLHTADRYVLTIHAPLDALPEHARIDPEDPPQVESGPVLAPETVRRLGCDAALVRLLETGAGEPLDVGRKTRTIPPALKRALQRRDGGCRFPGCTNARFVDGHHVVHWADGGATSLDNLLTVCRHHHGLLHEGGYYVVKDGADFLFFRGDGLPVPRVNDTLRPRRLPAAARRRCAAPRPIPPPWPGGGMRAAVSLGQPP
jgi:hypothetical protein